MRTSRAKYEGGSLTGGWILEGRAHEYRQRRVTLRRFGVTAKKLQPPAVRAKRSGWQTDYPPGLGKRSDIISGRKLTPHCKPRLLVRQERMPHVDHCPALPTLQTRACAHFRPSTCWLRLRNAFSRDQWNGTD